MRHGGRDAEGDEGGGECRNGEWVSPSTAEWVEERLASRASPGQILVRHTYASVRLRASMVPRPWGIQRSVMQSANYNCKASSSYQIGIAIPYFFPNPGILD